MDPRARTITEPTRKIDAVYNLNIGRVQAELDR